MTARPAPAGPSTAAARPTPVLYVHHGLNWITGSERCMLDLVTYVDRARYTPIVWCNAPAVAEAAAALGATVYLAPAWGDEGTLLPTRAHLRAARDIVRRHGVGLVHANDTAPLKALLPAAFGARIPVLAHLHLRLTPDERRWTMVHQASLAVGVSEAAVRGLRADGVAPDRAIVIYNGVDRARLARGDARGLRAQLGIAAGDVVFGVVASLIPHKGQDVVLSALGAIRERHPTAHLLLCGDGSESDRLREQAAALGVAARTHFLGRRTDVGALLRDAVDVLVSASRKESFGLNIAEGGVFGIPAIASDIEAHREIVTDGVEGLLFPMDDAAALATAMAALAGDPVRRAALGVAARERTLQSFLVERYVSDFEATYARLLAAPPRVYGWPGALTWPRTYTEWARSAARKQAARVLGRRAPAPA